MQEHPIIVFDSGFGGISVLKTLVKMMPAERYIYFGDSRNAPYGTRSDAEVLALTERAIDGLMPRAPKAVVIACNTASAAAEDVLRKKYADIPVIGTQPPLPQAAKAFPHGKILCLATAVTLRAARYADQLAALKTEIVSLAAPEIVAYVEGGMKTPESTAAALKARLAPYRDTRFDAVALGCTHFPFAEDIIESALSYKTVFFEPSVEVAEKTRAALAEKGTLGCGDGGVIIENSARGDGIPEYARMLLEK